MLDVWEGEENCRLGHSRRTFDINWFELSIIDREVLPTTATYKHATMHVFPLKTLLAEDNIYSIEFIVFFLNLGSRASRLSESSGMKTMDGI